MKSWFNSRSLVNKADLDRIYKYEKFSDSLWLYPEHVLSHWESTDKYIDIPEEVNRVYNMLGRPTPITRAKELEEYLGTDCKIFFKREDLLPNGSFKISSAIPQAYFGSIEGRKEVITETGAGQTGVAASLASCLFHMKSTIFMVRSSFNQKPLRRKLMEVYGSKVYPSPSEITQYGKQQLAMGNDSGSIAKATSEVFEVLSKIDNGMNIAGSLLDFTLTYNSVIGLESIAQLKEMGIKADTVIGCVGGGSSFGGLAVPFIDLCDSTEIIATESAAIPTLTKGEYKYDYADGEGESNPLLMYSLGHQYQPSHMHASGLRYHAASPIISYLVHKKRIRPVAYDEEISMKSAIQLSRLESFLVSPESSYTIQAVMETAKTYHGTGKVILALVTGCGHLDLDAYGKFIRDED
ncbi:TrpB-like pyridoxal phosphate-dependent enzyme [Paenibacillus mesotrionivorans]|uniref:TrpB-like pyridoxal phosphate-dependent enzyme n=1 Tax=Paenibacillus mesotrionivorans TaxID=3160968 RepID=A0ACC7NSQ9_9BACL